MDLKPHAVPHPVPVGRAVSGGIDDRARGCVRISPVHARCHRGQSGELRVEAERVQLREYLQRGGTLLGDSICASKAFTTAFRREIAAALPGTALTRIPITDPIFSNSFGGFDIRNVSLRDPASAEGNQPVAARVRQVEPQLEGIQIDGRWAVIFSPYDISCALESHEAIGCRGYTRQDAARIGLNVLLYSLNQ